MNDVAYEERRSGRRLRWSLPVLVDYDKTVCSASTEDLSVGGARLRTPVSLPLGSLVHVTNLQSGSKARFKVVWGSPARGSDNCYHQGLQMLSPSETFWGFDLSSGRQPLARPQPGGGLATQTLSWRNDQ